MKREWGGPVNAPYPPQPHTADPVETGNAWGRTDSVALGDTFSQHTVVRLNLQQSQQITIYNLVLNFPATTVALASGTNQRMYPWIQLTWGNGGASIQRNYRCDDFQEVTVVGTFIQAVPYIGDKDGNAIALPSILTPSAPPVMQISVFAGREQRPSPFANAYLIDNRTNLASHDNLFVGQLQIIGLQAHLTVPTVAPIFFQLYDRATAGIPASGTPLWESVLDPELKRYSNWQRFDPIPFLAGLTYGVSTTSGSFTDSGIGAWVQFQRYIL